MPDYTKVELEETRRALTSTLRKCEKMQESPRLGTSQRTLLERRIAALRISLALIEEKLEGKPIIMHSCGYVAPLLPGMIEAGIDCLQVIKVKAGMDLLELHRLYGDKIAFMGGIDVRALYTNDRAAIDAELEGKISFAKQGYNFVLHSDHSIPRAVDYETYRYFIEGRDGGFGNLTKK